jgi:hypothetical protein
MLRRFSPLFFLFIVVCSFQDCSNNPSVQKDTFGEVDRTAVGADTAMESNMDLSYEYQKTLIYNDSIVFDFLAYDRPKLTAPKEWEGKLIIIRRTNTKQDTVVKDSRTGAVKGLSIADLNRDHRPEIFFYEDQGGDKGKWRLRIYSQQAGGTFRGIYWREQDAKSAAGHYQAGDTFFVYQDHLIRRYPYYGHMSDTVADGSIWQSYKLVKDQLVLENEKIIH